MSEIFSLYEFSEILCIFGPNKKSIFTYQKGLGSKNLFSEMFLKLNFTSKYI